MRIRAAAGCGLLALAPALAQEAAASRPLTAVQFEGGDPDDRRFALAALGLKLGQPVDDAALQRALAAVRLMDRFRSVEGALDGEGRILVRLIPLPPLETWRWEGDALPEALRGNLSSELRKGQRLGPQRIEAIRGLAEQRLREGGYPKAKVQGFPEQEGRHLRLRLALGPPALIGEIRIEGDPAPYTKQALLKVAGLQPGKSYWTPATIREAQRRLRRRLVKDHRLEGSVRLAPVPGTEGVLLMEVHPGPKVRLKAKGMDLFGGFRGRPRLSEFVPLDRAERYAPGLLDEGADRIAAYYRDQGYPEARVAYRREVKAGSAEKPEAVTITYTVERGPQRTLGRVRFEGNQAVSEADLRAATDLPRRFFLFPPHAKAEAVKNLEERVMALYLQRGFSEARIRRRVETAKDGSVEVQLLIREGRRRFMDALALELPQGDGSFPRDALARSLLMALADRPVPVRGTNRFRSDRRHLQGFEGTLEMVPEGARLTFHPPLPLVRNDLALVLSDLKQRLSSAGAANPQVRLTLEEGEIQPVVRIQIPPQPMDQTQRLVVQGSDRTRAEAVLREIPITPGAALDPAKLDEGQVQLGGMGAFQRVDLLTLKDLPGQEKEPWRRGDLALRLLERSPWVFTESFGYDKTQGYHIGLNAQRLNVGGMGRMWEAGIRAGDQTLDIPAMRRAFPVGDVKRSVDTYSLGYTDPWFLPGALDALLAPRTRFHAEAAYIEEAQAAFFARRRRFTPSLEWKVGLAQAVQFGYRYERVEVASNVDSVTGLPLIPDQDLFILARTPQRSIISAPYLQIVVDRRDKPYDPTQGTFFLGRLELANQLFGTSPNSSFVKLDLRHQWNWPVGFHAEHGVLTAGVRIGLARPTARSAEDLPLSERFFGGGSFTVRGVEPDLLGEVRRADSNGNPLPHLIPLGGQAMVVANLEYRFPLFGQSVWAEVFVDAGQVYRSLQPEDGAAAPFPPLRTTVGGGLILKFGFPIKIEYAADWKRILGRPRTQDERDTQLKSLLISAGFQF